jgi:hypothetical protein
MFFRIVTNCAGSSAEVACSTLTSSCFNADKDAQRPEMLRVLPVGIIGKRHRNQQFVPEIVIGEREAGRQHSDDGAAHVVQLNHFADHIRRAAEVPLP